MSLIAEYRVSSPELPLMSALATVPEMTLSVEEEYATTPSEPVFFVWAEGDDFERFETAVEEDETVASMSVVDALNDRRLYRVQVSPQADVVMYPAGIDVGAAQLAVTATHEGLDVRQRFPSRAAFRTYRDRCTEMGVDFSLRRLYGLDDSQGSTDASYGLSQKQRETLTTAVSEGYFEVPRQCDLEDLASQLDVSKQSVSERLRRGTGRLVRSAFAVDEE